MRALRTSSGFGARGVAETALLAGALVLSHTAAARAQSDQLALATGDSVPLRQPTVLTIAAGVPLRIAVTRRAKLTPGALVEAKLLEPVFVGAQLALLAGSRVSGHIIESPAVDRRTRVSALFDGDFTPLRRPVVDFDTVWLPSGETLPIKTRGEVRQAKLIRFVAGRRPSLFAQIKATAVERVRSVRDQFSAPHRSDRALSFAYKQLPYHPQRVWAETEFDAEVQTAVPVPVVRRRTFEEAPEDALQSLQPLVRARLIESVSSDTAKNGDPVHAVLTEPVWDQRHRLIFPEGAALTGVVLQARPSRSLGRNGALRFAFRGVESATRPTETVRGQVTGAEGQASANVSVDQEGGIQAHPDKNRFAGPLLLAALAAGGLDQDGGAGRQGAASNGLGIVVRLVGLTAGSQSFAAGVGAYGAAKSICRHFLAHGKAVAFPRDTAVEVQLSARR